METPQSEIKAFLQRQPEAVRARDIDRLMALYSPQIIYFDVVPPLEYAGAAALRRRFLDWFDAFQGAIVMEVRNLKSRRAVMSLSPRCSPTRVEH